MSRDPLRSINYRQSSVNSDMLPMIRYCILLGTVQYGTVLAYSHSPSHDTVGPFVTRYFSKLFDPTRFASSVFFATMVFFADAHH